jgi:hypothetical protein
MPRPAHITRYGPHKSDNAPENQAATAAVTPYAVKTAATSACDIPRCSRYGER